MDWDTTCRSQIVLFETIYRLHLDLNQSDSNSERWSFEVRIPEHPKRPEGGRPDRSDKLEPWPGFLTNQRDCSLHGLPGSYACVEEWDYDIFVEYYLRAHRLVSPTNGSTKDECTLPVNVQPWGMPEPIRSLHLKDDREYLTTVRSPKCLAENAGKELSLRDRLKSKMSGRTPQYVFAVNVVAPSVLQLAHPDHLPLRVYLTPKWGEGMSNFAEGDPNSLPPTTLKAVKVQLVASLIYRAPTVFSHTVEGREVEYDFTLAAVPDRIFVPILLPREAPPNYHEATGREATEGKAFWWKTPKDPVSESETLDIGRLLDIRTERIRAPYPYPSFKSYNVAVSHKLVYKITMQTADEEHTIEGRMPVTLLAPAEETRMIRRAERTREDEVKEWMRYTGTHVLDTVGTRKKELEILWGSM
jgi:hypothetical protein